MAVFGDDALQVKVIVFCMIVSLGATFMLPVMFPEWDVEDADGLAEARQTLENYSGESMANMSPWVLKSVRTPYTANAQANVLSEYGWVYGSIDDYYALDGTVYLNTVYSGSDIDYSSSTFGQIIKLDPTKTSRNPLSQTTADWYGTVYTDWSEGNTGVMGGLVELWNKVTSAPDYIAYWLGFGDDPGEDTGTHSLSAFNFTGLMYHFELTYRMDTQGTDATSLNSDYGSFNLVWYKNSDSKVGEGLSGGLVLYSNKTNAIIRNISVDDILDEMNTKSTKATKYVLNYDGMKVNMYLRFDPQVLTTNMNLETAWAQGLWTVSFASPSADGLMDLVNSNNFASSMGNIIDTFASIMTFDMPNVEGVYQVILWVICVLPLGVCSLIIGLRVLEAVKIF